MRSSIVSPSKDWFVAMTPIIKEFLLTIFSWFTFITFCDFRNSHTICIPNYVSNSWNFMPVHSFESGYGCLLSSLLFFLGCYSSYYFFWFHLILTTYSLVVSRPSSSCDHNRHVLCLNELVFADDVYPLALRHRSHCYAGCVCSASLAASSKISWFLALQSIEPRLLWQLAIVWSARLSVRTCILLCFLGRCAGFKVNMDQLVDEVLLLTAIIATISLTLWFFLVVKLAIVAVPWPGLAPLRPSFFWRGCRFVVGHGCCPVLFGVALLCSWHALTPALKLDSVVCDQYFFFFLGAASVAGLLSSPLATTGLADTGFSAFFSTLAFGAAGFASALEQVV